MSTVMTRAFDHAAYDRIDRAIDAAIMVARVLGYVLVWWLAARHPIAAVVMGGMFVGDLIGRAVAVAIALVHGEPVGRALGEIGLVLGAWLLLGGRAAWPDDPAERALLGLAAFGMFAATTGRAFWTHLLPRDR
jgi:hypothetical protein